jgi:tripartite-type tricarboxylate transporter receptor subunit TctC
MPWRDLGLIHRALRLFQAVRRAWITAPAFAGCLLASAALAQSYPSKPIMLILPFPAGSGIDVTARLVADQLGAKLGQPVVVENKAGANGAIAATYVARSAPDGYTLFMTTNSTHSANPWLLKNISYDPIKDFTPIARMGNLPFIMVVNAKLGVRTFAEFVAYARARPGKLTYATSNATGVIGAATVSRLSGLELVQVPYTSAPQAMQDMLRGDIAMMFVDYASGLPHVQAGSIVALTVTTANRSPLLPDVPSMKEVGLPEFDMNSWNAIFAPAKTPPAIVNSLNQALRAIIDDPKVREKMRQYGFDAFSSSPQELDSFVRDELEKWRKWIQEAKIEPQ